jgi:hexosaminidase
MLPAETLAALAAKEPPRITHAARDKLVRLTAPPDPRYPGAGESTLVDGELALANYQSGQWLGFYGDDLEAVVDLESVVPVRAVAVRCLQSADVGIFLPAGVEIALSRDGKDFKPAARLDRPGATADGGPLIRTLRAEFAAEPARWVRIRVRNVRVMPTDPPATARKAWLFVDEILVNP